MSPKNNRVLLTGGHGFLGKTIYRILTQSDYQVTRVGRSLENDIVCDLSETSPKILSPIDLVIHNAGKAHAVPKTEKERDEFYNINVKGTQNLLSGIAQLPVMPQTIVFVSTIAVYGLIEGENISEEAPLLAQDPYGRSKIEAEQLLQKWCGKNAVPLTILRLPLVAGERPPGNLGAMINGLKTRRYVSIAGGRARKSMVMADDVARSIPMASMYPGIYNLSDGYHPAFNELEALMAKQLHRNTPANIPAWLATCLGWTGDVLDKIFPGKSPITSAKLEKIKSTLTFSDQKARITFGWNPNRVIDVFRIG